MIRVVSSPSALEQNIISPLKKQVTLASDAGISLAAMTERALNVSKQMRYFALVIRRGTFPDLAPSAGRAGFIMISEDAGHKEASFRWNEERPDFTFLVSFKSPDICSVIAESLGDISGLILTGSSRASTITVETGIALGEKALGPHALRFRNVLLMLPGFDDTPAWMKL